MRAVLFTAATFLLLNACSNTDHDLEEQHKAVAERFFRGVYGCDPSVVDDLAGDDIVLSYPVFEEMYNTPAFHGREEVRRFADGFCSRWRDSQITLHDSIAEGDRVVFVWSFRARFVGTGAGADENQPPANQEQSWGGLTLYRFDDAGKIVAEVGEESTPGPAERLAFGRAGQ